MTTLVSSLTIFILFKNQSLILDDAPLLLKMLDTFGGIKVETNSYQQRHVEANLVLTAKPSFSGAKCFFENYIFLVELLESPFYRSLSKEPYRWKMLELRVFSTIIDDMLKQYPDSLAIKSIAAVMQNRFITSARLNWMKTTISQMKSNGASTVFFSSEIGAITWINNFEKQARFTS